MLLILAPKNGTLFTRKILRATDHVGKTAHFNIEARAPFEKTITGCASCTYMLKDDAALFSGETEQKEAQNLASKELHISEFLHEDQKNNAEK